MKLIFQHLDDDHDPRNGKVLDQTAVIRLLDELRLRQPPTMCQFVGDNGFNLTVGIDNDFGCIQYSRNDGLPPYLMAKDVTRDAADFRDLEFVVGGTLTPIDSQYRVPLNMIKEVLLEFIESGERTEAVAWQEF